MPKLPLFKDEPLNQGMIGLLKQMREHPKTEVDSAIINDLTILAQYPWGPMSEQLVYFCVEIGLMRPQILENMLVNTLSRPRLGGIQAEMRLEMNQWLLTHARAGGIVPTEQ